MIKLTQEEGNAIIAKFMGYEYYEPGVLVDYSDCGGIYDSVNVYSKTPILVDDYGDGQKYFADVPNPDYKNNNNPKWNRDLETLSWATLNEYITELKYHDSWDWLMPAIKKSCDEISALGFNSRGDWHPEHGYVSKIYVMRLNSSIEEAWYEVVNYILKKNRKNETNN